MKRAIAILLLAPLLVIGAVALIGTRPAQGDSFSGGGLVDPTTTRGDIIVRGASGLTRLGRGTAGKILYSDGTDILASGSAFVVSATAVSGRFRMSANMTNVTSGVWTTLALDTVDYNNGLTLTTNQIIVPLAARYIICATAYFQDSVGTGARAIAYKINNSSLTVLTQALGNALGENTLNGSIILNLAANDVITVQISQTSGSGQTVNNAHTGVSISLLAGQ